MEPNILLLILDSVRARNTGLHDHVNPTTPFLDEFAAEEATVYRQARAPGARSITSHASIFTGLEVEEHGITSADRRLKPGTTVFEQLQDEGYETGVFSENVWITDVDIGLSRGFDTIVGPQAIPFPDAVNPRKFVAEEGPGQYREFISTALKGDKPVRSLLNGVHTKLGSDFDRFLPGFDGIGSQGSLYRDRFLAWVDDVDGHWAACINLMDAHTPYKPREEFDLWGDSTLHAIEENAPSKWKLHDGTELWWRQEAREDLYDGAIRQADSYVGDIVAGLRERGELDDTLVVVTSDHGEGFGERSRIRDARVAAHSVSAHEVLLHVPLVVKLPGQDDGDTVDRPAAIRRFPDAVQAVREGTTDSHPFVSSDPVIATVYGLTEDDQLRARASRYCDNLSAFDGVSRVAYERREDGLIEKKLTWQSRESTVEVRDAQTSYRIQDSDRIDISGIFEAVEQLDVRDRGGGMADVDAATYDRLEKLGYV